MTELAETYADGGFLDAKWDVMRRHRTSAQSFEDWLLDRLPIRPGLQVLDVGAGSGRFALPLARRLGGTGRVLALDLLPEVMAPIRRSGRNVETVVGDAARPPADLGRFDVVLAAHMLYHLDDVVAGVRALAALLRPGGLFVATTNVGVGMREMFELHLAAMRALGLPAEDTAEPERFGGDTGAALLEQVFADVQRREYDGGFVAASADPVFAYYAATELYRRPMRDDRIGMPTRLRLAPTYVHLAQEMINDGGPLHVHKDMVAFFCRGTDSGE
jgi:SAM-dependent methyltransferase